MNFTKMFSTVFFKYDPKDTRTHGILKFFAEDLTENEKIHFVSLLYDKGSWMLATEVSNASDSQRLKSETKEKFLSIFNKWVSERIDHSSILSKDTRNPYLPRQYAFEFKEALFSIRNLDFQPDTMLIFERFLKECHTSYLKKYLDGCFRFIIEEFNIDEIEIFFTYFLKIYIKEKSTNLENFIYGFLNSFAYSHNIFNLSSNFLENLKLLKIHFESQNNQNNFHNLISILLIELIANKELDLSNSNYDDIIESTINGLNKGEYENLELYVFLKSFNFQFKNIDFNLEINFIFEKLNTNVYLADNYSIGQKYNIIHHYVNSSDQYFEFLLFCLEHCSEKLVKEYIINFIKLIDQLTISFSSVLWFEDYLNFNKINGKIISVVKGGYRVKLDQDFFDKKVENIKIENSNSETFVSKYGYCFLNNSSLREFPKAQKLYSTLQGNLTKNRTEISIDKFEIEEFDSFIISNVNYSGSNKGNVITLVPEDNKLRTIISKYKLKSFFSSIELFFIEKACEYMHLESPFQSKKQLLDKLIYYNNNNSHKIKMSEESFWDILASTRPHLYDTLYVNYKNEEKSFNRLLEAYESGEIINGLVKSRTKGGLFVEMLGIAAFLPGSQIDIKPIVDYDFYVGKTMEFKIVKVYPEFKNVVVSHKVIFEEEIEIQKKQIISKLERGQIFEGIVKNITSYGVFIEMGGIDGLIHINDLTWTRINHPSDILELDQKINVVVLDFDIEKTRIQLGLKQLYDHPWNTAEKTLKIGDKVKGKVGDIEEFGLFVELASGIEGLVHISELSWEILPTVKKERKLFAQKLFARGDEVEAIIMSLDSEERKIALSIKRITQDPWFDIISKYPIGSIHIGIVNSFTNFGVFVVLDEYITGMIFISELSWNIKFKHPSHFINIGDKLEVIVLEINTDECKLSLSHKQTTINPWDQHEITYAVGTIHFGKIYEIVQNGATIKFGENIIAFIENSNLVRENGIKLDKGDSSYFTVIEFNKESKRIRVSPIAQLDTDKKNKQEKDSKNSKSINNKFLKKTNEYLNLGDIVKGKVITIEDYGAFIEVINEVETLIRVSEMSWNPTLCQAVDFMNVGDIIEAVVIGIDKFNNIVQLSTKQLLQDPWLDINDKFPIGSKHIGKVIRFVNFGIYVRLADNNIGYIANSNLSWFKKFNHPSEFVNIGDILDVIILQTNSTERKINLGHKQTTSKN